MQGWHEVEGTLYNDENVGVYHVAYLLPLPELVMAILIELLYCL